MIEEVDTRIISPEGVVYGGMMNQIMEDFQNILCWCYQEIK
jgi:hypothetical protein